MHDPSRLICFRAELGNKALPGDHLGIGGNMKAVTGKLFIFNGNEKKTSIKGSTVIRIHGTMLFW